MKHLSFVTITLLLLTANTGIAQTDWKLGGNPVTSDSRIGTNSGYDLIFETANLERMRLSDAGYFGIGIGTPSATLHVSGEFQMDGDIRLGDWVDTNAEPKRYTYIDTNGTLKMMGSSELIGQMYEVDCILKEGQPLPVPVWHAVSGILYTGAGCPAKVGIGTASPEEELEVAGTIFTRKLTVGANEEDASYRMRVFGLGTLETSYSIFNLNNDGDARFSYFGDEQGSPFVLRNGVTDKTYMHLHPSGTIDYNYFGGMSGSIVWSVRNGNAPPEVDPDIAVLTSDGKWWCQGLVVKHVPFWPDYVFESTYQLKPLGEVAAYIEQNHHLPDMPSADEVAANGIAVEEMLRLLTLKVEELTLHAIAQEKEIAALKAQVDVPVVIETEKK